MTSHCWIVGIGTWATIYCSKDKSTLKLFQWLWSILTPASQGQCGLSTKAINKKVHISETDIKRKKKELLVEITTNQRWFQTRLLAQKTEERKSDRIFPSQLKETVENPQPTKHKKNPKPNPLSHSFKKQINDKCWSIIKEGSNTQMLWKYLEKNPYENTWNFAIIERAKRCTRDLGRIWKSKHSVIHQGKS